MGKTRLIKIFLLVILFIGSISITSAQDVDGLLNLIQVGEMDSARTILTDLSYKYPGHPGVRYARAIMQDDALVAAGIYKDILRNHAGSEFVASALMHLGEYYYAQGLYIQSRQNFSRLIRNHPDHPDIINAVNLMLRAGLASRQMDSVYIDLASVLDLYPNVAFDIPEELDLTRIPGRKQFSKGTPETPPQDVIPIRSLGQDINADSPDQKGTFSLQAGAFGNYDNAKRLADQIESIGYTTSIKERSSNGKTLYLIMVGNYSSKTAAVSVADMLDAALGIPSFPVAND
ncbi:MAG: SPOR domain-containing protein [Candidatus Marinimicrobia bacterium]|nr:SPOR domain-containing protein [Candidatus Neomarinimicrobiota bacterium]